MLLVDTAKADAIDFDNLKKRFLDYVLSTLMLLGRFESVSALSTLTSGKTDFVATRPLAEQSET